MGEPREVIAIYSRKSRYTGKGESIGNQVELCRGYIRTVFGEQWDRRTVVYEDEGFSGGNLNRPDFKRMMQAARNRQLKAVVVYRLDRISRNISDFSALIQELGQLGVDFVSIRESFDTSSPMGRAMMYIASVFSQLERETIAERIRDNLHELAKTGRWLGGTTPTGYTSEAVKSVTVDGKSKRSCRLKLIPQEAQVVRTIYRLYSETDSLTKTEAELLRRQIRTKTGRNFTRFSIKGILQNPVYVLADQEIYRYFQRKQANLYADPEEFDGQRGMVAYHRTRQEKGRSTVYLPVSQWVVSVGQHPGIIPSKEWIQVQESLERNQSKAYRKPRRNQALLTGLLWCSCGGRMYPKLSQRRGEDGEPLYTYVCKQKERSRGTLCNGWNAQGNQLDAVVLERIGAHLEEDRNCFLNRLEKGKKSWDGSQNSRQQEREDLRRQQEEIQHKIEALVDSLADFQGSTAADSVKRRVEQLQLHTAQLESQLCQLEEQGDQPPHWGEEENRLLQVLPSFQECLKAMTVEEKRATLWKILCKVVWDGTCAHVILFGAEKPEGLPDGELFSKDATPHREEDQGPDHWGDSEEEGRAFQGPGELSSMPI